MRSATGSAPAAFVSFEDSVTSLFSFLIFETGSAFFGDEETAA